MRGDSPIASSHCWFVFLLWVNYWLGKGPHFSLLTPVFMTENLTSITRKVPWHIVHIRAGTWPRIFDKNNVAFSTTSHKIQRTQTQFLIPWSPVPEPSSCHHPSGFRDCFTQLITLWQGQGSDSYSRKQTITNSSSQLHSLLIPDVQVKETLATICYANKRKMKCAGCFLNISKTLEN